MYSVILKEPEKQIQTQMLPMDRQTELMLQYGPKDTCWAATYQKEDEPLLKKYFIKSATFSKENNNPMIDDFFIQLENKFNDHKGVLSIDSQHFEIVEISKTNDIPTVQGLQHCCKQIISGVTSSTPPGTITPWRYHGVGSSAIEPRAYQQKLYTETTPRADMTVAGQGSFTRSNQSMRAVGIFPSTFATITVRESGIFTTATGYTAPMLNRQVFASNPITHTVNVAPFTVATDINFISVTRWL